MEVLIYCLGKELPIGTGGWALFIDKFAPHLHHPLNYYLRPSTINYYCPYTYVYVAYIREYWTDINALYTTPFVRELVPGGPTRGYRAA